jgi:hypothetical protein
LYDKVNLEARREAAPRVLLVDSLTAKKNYEDSQTSGRPDFASPSRTENVQSPPATVSTPMVREKSGNLPMTTSLIKIETIIGSTAIDPNATTGEATDMNKEVKEIVMKEVIDTTEATTGTADIARETEVMTVTETGTILPETTQAEITKAADHQHNLHPTICLTTVKKMFI